ncbi:MAG: tetratricopeptide repeat protein [Cyclobacteriaceae bacterium]
MKYIFLILLLSITDPLKTTKINNIKKEAGEAYKAGNYDKAAAKYSLLADSLGVSEDEILLNLGHSYYHLGDTSSAKRSYQSLLTSSNKNLKSIASQQLGVMAKDAQKLEESLSYLKNAIKTNPKNEGAKYDYEVVKKLLEQQEKQEQENQNNENEDIEPSEYAKAIKAQADRLRYQGRFIEALNTFKKGLEKDNTVSAYNDIIGRLTKVTGNE